MAILTPTLFWSTAALFVVSAYIYHLRSTAWRVVPQNIPWVPAALPWSNWLLRPLTRIRAHMRDLHEGTDLVMEGYEKYSKNDQPFVVPSFVTWHPEVVLPPSQIRWLVEQPDSDFSIERSLSKHLEFHYTAPASGSYTRPFHVEAINKLRTDALIDDIAEEIQIGIDEQWGMVTEEWTDFNIDHTMHHVLIRLTSRVFYGVPLCHDPSFLKATTTFINHISTRSILISLTPEFLRPLFAYYLTRPLKRATATCTAALAPLITTSLHISNLPSPPPAKTLLEQLARLAARSADPTDFDAGNLAGRLVALHFVAVHTSLHTLENALVDIVSPPASNEKILAQLRIEAAETLASHNGRWSKPALSSLVKTDSALRESLRLSNFKSRGVERLVVKKGGVVLPSGEWLAEGTRVGVPLLPIHHDEAVYEEALKYDALRFCGGKEEGGAATGLINASETFLAFGFGRHACPGRFIAACELKLIVAYIALNYEIEALEVRPPNARFSDFNIGNMHCVRVRRRKGRGEGWAVCEKA